MCDMTLPFSLGPVVALLQFDVARLPNAFAVPAPVSPLLPAAAFSPGAFGSPSLPTGQETISVGGNSCRRIPTLSAAV